MISTVVWFYFTLPLRVDKRLLFSYVAQLAFVAICFLKGSCSVYSEMESQANFNLHSTPLVAKDFEHIENAFIHHSHLFFENCPFSPLVHLSTGSFGFSA